MTNKKIVRLRIIQVNRESGEKGWKAGPIGDDEQYAHDDEDGNDDEHAALHRRHRLDIVDVGDGAVFSCGMSRVAAIISRLIGWHALDKHLNAAQLSGR